MLRFGGISSSRLLMPARGNMLFELRRCWLITSMWQLLTFICAGAAAGAIHKPIAIAFALLALLALRSLARSLGIWRGLGAWRGTR